MAARFWVGGAGTWDASDTTHWAASSGGAGGQSVPVAADDVTFDGSSGGGTVTVNHASLSINSLTCGAHTGTLTFATNNNNITIATTFSGSGSGTRTLNMGNGTWTLPTTTASNVVNFSTVTNLTFSANSSTIALTGNALGTATRVIVGGGLTFNAITIAAAAGGVNFSTAFTVSSLTTSAAIQFGADATITTLNITGTSTAPILVISSALSLVRIITTTTTTATWAAFRAISFSIPVTATNSLDLGNNTNLTATVPSGGGGTSGGVSRGSGVST